MYIKIFFAIIGTVISLAAFFPYIKDILQKKTKPHSYTWLIWIIVQGIATAGIVHGGGKWGALELGIATLLVAFVFILSVKYGTKNILIIDTLSLLAAIVATVIWWELKNASLAVFIVTIIDIIGYIPTIRKTFYEPWSETLGTWTAFTAGNIFSILAMSQYNFLTLFFVVLTTIGNGLIAMIVLWRRKVIPKPN